MKLAGLIGRPVTHSIGQAVYNRFFHDAGLDAVYLSIDVMPENLPRFIELSREYFAGFNVTIPHKISVMQHLDVIDFQAEQIGSVNLVKNQDGNLTGYNTDFPAMEALASRSGMDFEKSTIAVSGSGGVARTVIHYISSRHPGTSVTVLSRNPGEAEERLEDLTAGLDISYMDSAGDGETLFDILVNCTPVGMSPGKGTPFTERLISGCRAGIDLVYNPPETAFLRALKEKGKMTAGGLDFFVDQGIESMKILFDRSPERELFRRSATEALEGMK